MKKDLMRPSDLVEMHGHRETAYNLTSKELDVVINYERAIIHAEKFLANRHETRELFCYYYLKAQTYFQMEEITEDFSLRKRYRLKANNAFDMSIEVR